MRKRGAKKEKGGEIRKERRIQREDGESKEETRNYIERKKE